jgi:hypothetical protein
MNMNTQNVEINDLSDDELDAVAGGAKNWDNPAVMAFLMAFAGSAGNAGARYFIDRFPTCGY